VSGNRSVRDCKLSRRAEGECFVELTRLVCRVEVARERLA